LTVSVCLCLSVFVSVCSSVCLLACLHVGLLFCLFVLVGLICLLIVLVVGGLSVCGCVSSGCLSVCWFPCLSVCLFLFFVVCLLACLCLFVFVRFVCACICSCCVCVCMCVSVAVGRASPSTRARRGPYAQPDCARASPAARRRHSRMGDASIEIAFGPCGHPQNPRPAKGGRNPWCATLLELTLHPSIGLLLGSFGTSSCNSDVAGVCLHFEIYRYRGVLKSRRAACKMLNPVNMWIQWMSRHPAFTCTYSIIVPLCFSELAYPRKRYFSVPARKSHVNMTAMLCGTCSQQLAPRCFQGTDCARAALEENYDLKAEICHAANLGCMPSTLPP
jgi:hypothetical protein